MSVPSIEFVLAFLVLAALFHVLPSARLRRGLLACANAGFIWLTVPDGRSLLALGIFTLSGFAAARLLMKRPSRWIFSSYLTALILAFMILKKYVLVGMFLPAWIMDHPINAVGLSYILFRQIHFVVDAMQGQIADFSLFSYANYQFNLFGFISGPIQRYQEFDGPWREMRPLLTARHEILQAYLRLFVGAIKVSLISNLLLTTFVKYQSRFLEAGELNDVSRAEVLIRFAMVYYSYPIYLYFNFSGYCDVVISAAALVGMKMPENFDRPYLSRNVSDYWTRFHQSLGFWIRDYLFTPMYKAAASRWSERALLVYPCYLVAFVLAGLWHGNSMNFLVFGLLHGLGVCSGKLWETHLLKRRGRKGLKAYLASGPIRIGAIFLTLNFVCFTILFFPHDLQTTMKILRNFAHYMGA